MKRSIEFALLLSMVINAALLYRIFDFGVTVTHRADEIHYRDRQATDLEKLLPLLLKTASQEQVILAGRQAELEVIEKLGEGVYIGTVFFSYSGGKITAVHLRRP